MFERLAGLANDVGLLSEEYDATAGRMLGNVPQAFTHVSLINTAGNLSSKARPAVHRATGWWLGAVRPRAQSPAIYGLRT